VDIISEWVCVLNTFLPVYYYLGEHTLFTEGIQCNGPINMIIFLSAPAPFFPRKSKKYLIAPLGPLPWGIQVISSSAFMASVPVHLATYLATFAQNVHRRLPHLTAIHFALPFASSKRSLHCPLFQPPCRAIQRYKLFISSLCASKDSF
jgi:hypothetical protein